MSKHWQLPRATNLRARPVGDIHYLELAATKLPPVQFKVAIRPSGFRAMSQRLREDVIYLAERAKYPWHIWLGAPAWAIGRGFVQPYFDKSPAYDSPRAEKQAVEEGPGIGKAS